MKDKKKIKKGGIANVRPLGASAGTGQENKNELIWGRRMNEIGDVREKSYLFIILYQLVRLPACLLFLFLIDLDEMEFGHFLIFNVY